MGKEYLNKQDIKNIKDSVFEIEKSLDYIINECDDVEIKKLLFYVLQNNTKPIMDYLGDYLNA